MAQKQVSQASPASQAGNDQSTRDNNDSARRTPSPVGPRGVAPDVSAQGRGARDDGRAPRPENADKGTQRSVTAGGENAANLDSGFDAEGDGLRNTVGSDDDEMADDYIGGTGTRGTPAPVPDFRKGRGFRPR